MQALAAGASRVRDVRPTATSVLLPTVRRQGAAARPRRQVPRMGSSLDRGIPGRRRTLPHACGNRCSPRAQRASEVRHGASSATAAAKQPGICRDSVPDVQSRRHRPTDSSARRHETRRASGRVLTPPASRYSRRGRGRAPCAIWRLDASHVDGRCPSAGTVVLLPARSKARKMPIRAFSHDSEVPHRNLIECSRLSTSVGRSLIRAGTRSRLLR